MKILVLHSDIPGDAPPEDQDTLIAADAVAVALHQRGHKVTQAPFREQGLAALLARDRPEMVFNMVEGVDGKGLLASIAPRLLEEMGMPFTGAPAKPMDVTFDKALTKRLLREAGLATPDWSAPPDWRGLDGRAWIVKAALEDGSIGLDDGCVVPGPDVPARAAASSVRFGGRWFAEEYVEGREFNIALLGSAGNLRILPMAEMTFADWPPGKPRIVGYGAKWEEEFRRLPPDGAPLRGGARRAGPGPETQSGLRKSLAPVRAERFCAGGFSGTGRRGADTGDQRQSRHRPRCGFCRGGGASGHGL